MSHYSEKLACARYDALQVLIDAMRQADSPAEKRRCAVALLNAPDPCDLDNTIELIDDDDDPEHTPGISESAPHTPGMSESSSESRGSPNEHTPGMSESASESRGYPTAHAPTPTLIPSNTPPPHPATRPPDACQRRPPLEDAHHTSPAHEMRERPQARPRAWSPPTLDTSNPSLTRGLLSPPSPAHSLAARAGHATFPPTPT